MKKQVAAIFVFLSAVLTSEAWSFERGTGSSGGGGAIVCYSADRSIRSVELYDLFQGRTLFHYPDHLSGRRSNGFFIKDYLERALHKLWNVDAAFAGLILQKTEHFSKNIRWQSKLLRPMVHDFTFPEVMISGCEYEQVAQWDDHSKKIVVQSEIYSAMSSKHKAALIIHEAIYAQARENNVFSSDQVREVVAQLFSDVQVNPWLIESFFVKTQALKMSVEQFEEELKNLDL